VNSKDLNKESDISKVIKEDILRILGERKMKVSLETIKPEIKVTNSLLSKAIKSLEEKNMIQVENGVIRTTKKGQEESKSLLKKHRYLENYFKEKRSEQEAYQVANIIEHYISKEALNKIKKFFPINKEGISLLKFGLKREGLITDIEGSDYKLFERLVSMGILPGEIIEIRHKIPTGIIVKTNNKIIFLAKTIAKKIKVVEI